VRLHRPAAIVSPESIASILVGVLAVVVMAAQVVASPATTPTGSPSPEPTSSALPAAGFPPLIGSSLATVLVVNERLADRARALGQAIAAKKPVGDDIATILRGINTEMAVGNEAANLLKTFPPTLSLGEALAALYAKVAAQNAETLGTSINNVAAYVDGGRKVIRLLAGLEAVNERVRQTLAGPPSQPPPSVRPASPSPASPPSLPATAPPSAPPTVAPSASPSAGSGVPLGPSLIVNGDFEQGLTGWRLLVTQPASAKLTIEPKAGLGTTAAARIDIAVGSDARAGVSLAGDGIHLRQGAAYTVTAAVRAAQPREVRIRLAGAGDLTYSTRIFTVGTTWTVVSFELTQLVDDPAAVLTLDLGRSAATVWFDNVSLRESPG
jgi:carbohydrate binding protein with CBM4/9 domain